MRHILTLATTAAAILLSGTADASRHSSGHRSYHARSYHYPGYHRAYTHRSYYHGSGTYRAQSGHYVHRPMHASTRPDGATARCRDGSWSFSESRRGTCSWHGGVAVWVH